MKITHSQLKELIREEVRKKMQSEAISEDAVSSIVLLNALIVALASVARMSGKSPADFFNPKDIIKWVKDNWRYYTKLKPILKKLDSDPEVQEFIKRDPDNRSSNHPGFHKLIKSKLNSDELKYLKQIRFGQLPSVKDTSNESINEGFSTSQQKKIADEVKRCYDEKGNNGVRDYDTLNKYLFNLPFEVDAADIKIEGWVSNSFNRQNKSAKIMLQGKQIGSLDS